MKPVPTLLLTLAFGAAGWFLGAPRSGMPQAGSSPASAASSPRASDGKEANPASSADALSGKEASALEKEYLELLRLDPRDWPERLRQAFRQGKQDELKWLAERWAARDPAALLAFMRSPAGLGFRIDAWPDWTVTQACFEAWFRKDMNAAVAAMESLTQFNASEGRMAYGAWQVIMTTLMTVDPARALKFLGDHPDFHGGLIMNYADCRSLAPLAVSMPECAGRQRLLSSILQGFLHDSDPAKGLENGLVWLGKLDPARRLEAVPELAYLEKEELTKMREVLKQAFTTADLAVLDTKDAKSAAAGAEKLGRIAQLRTLHDPQAAMDWAAALPGQAKLTAMSAILEVSAPDKPENASAFLENFPAGPLHDRARISIADKLRANVGNRGAMDWLVSLPDLRDTRAGISQLMRNWALNDPVESVAWVSALPTSPLKLQAAAEAINGSSSDAAKLDMAARLPADLGLEALTHSWSGITQSDSRPLAEAAALQPPGPIREAAMEKASRDGYMKFNGYTQAWLDWAAALPTPADRAAAWRGAEKIGDGTNWGEGVREKAREQLSGGAGL